MASARSSEESKNRRGTREGSSPPPSTSPCDDKTRAYHNASIVSFSEYQRQLKSATDDLPVSCFILFCFLQIFKIISTKINTYPTFCLVFQEYLLSFVPCRPWHFIDLLLRLKYSLCV